MKRYAGTFKYSGLFKRQGPSVAQWVSNLLPLHHRLVVVTGKQQIETHISLNYRYGMSEDFTFLLDQDILLQLEKEKVLAFTPARRIGGKRVVCYDDRYILNLAMETGGIIVSNDNYRDLVSEKPDYRKVVEDRLLMYTFVNDRLVNCYPPPLSIWGSVLLYLRSPKGVCCSISDDLICSLTIFWHQTLWHYKCQGFFIKLHPWPVIQVSFITP